MLSPFDDYPVHQTAAPIAHPATGDANQYDRYFFNGYRDDLYFGVAMGVYPNRGIIDAAVSVVRDGDQRSLFASGRIPLDRARTEVGPIRIEILEPLRSLRITADGADRGVAADLRFDARTPAVEEPRQTMHAGTRLVMDATRMTQWGIWSGWVQSGDERIDLDAGGSDGSSDAGGTLGTKDRSWGIRPVGEQAEAAPSDRPPQIFFLWSPLNFDDCATHLALFERSDGERWMQQGAVVPLLSGDDDPAYGVDDRVGHTASVDYEIEWERGLRRSRSAAVILRPVGGGEHRIDLEPRLAFRMRGIGYTHPTWSHGRWHGELAVGDDEQRVEDLDSLDPSCIHVQQVVRATWGERRGMGVLEQLVFGPHEPTGLADFLDGG